METNTITGCLAVIAEAAAVERKLHELFKSDRCDLTVEDHTSVRWAMDNGNVWMILNDEDERPTSRAATGATRGSMSRPSAAPRAMYSSPGIPSAAVTWSCGPRGDGDLRGRRRLGAAARLADGKRSDPDRVAPACETH